MRLSYFMTYPLNPSHISPHHQKKCDNMAPPILVFDSGIGGMGFVQALQKITPSLPIDYLADTKFFPYGEKSDDILIERIISLITNASNFLSPALIVIACNTASTLALNILREHLSLPIVGCVPPIRWAGRVSKTRTIGLLATSATAKRPYIHHLHQEFASDCQLLIHGGRALADLAEKAFYGEILPLLEVKKEVNALLTQKDGNKIDVIGLGCTHYTFLMPYFQQLHETAITWLDPAPAVAQQALKKLKETHYPLSQISSTSNRFFTTAALQEKNHLKNLALLNKMGFREHHILSL